MVERVVLEHDEADGVDDVAVFYRSPGVNAGDRMVTADFFQLKYHVDQRDAYSSTALSDPSFLKGKSSLLQRFYKAYANLKDEHEGFRLHLASNWRWRNDDQLANGIREYDGGLPPNFFKDEVRRGLGKVREAWRKHLGIEEEEFFSFARTLRFQLDHFGRRDFKSLVYLTLNDAGLKTPAADKMVCPYESLVQQFLMNGLNTFDRSGLRALCTREELFDERANKPETIPSIGVRSFMRFGERLDDEVDALACVSRHFQGRHPQDADSWEKGANEIRAFFADEGLRGRLRQTETSVALECHGSYAMLAGWELSRNSGALIYPLQKPDRTFWRPASKSPAENGEWQAEEILQDETSSDVAVCLSVTHEIRKEVLEFLSSSNAPRVSKVVVLTAGDGPSPLSIQGPDHAYALAAQFSAQLKAVRPTRGSRVHLFFACPNAVMFFIGQQREALGRITLYEYDFGMEREGTYQASISLPKLSEKETSGGLQ